MKRQKLRKKENSDHDAAASASGAEEGMDSTEPKRKKSKKNKPENDSSESHGANSNHGNNDEPKRKKKKMGSLAQPSRGELEPEESPLEGEESPSHVQGDIMIGASPTIELSTAEQKKKIKHKELFQLKYEEWKKEAQEKGAK